MPEPLEVHRVSHPEALLYSRLFPNVLVEVDYVAPFVPTPYALAGLEDFLRVHAGKQSVEFLPAREIPPQGEFVSSKRLFEIAQRTADEAPAGVFARGDTALLHVLYLEGEYERPSLGVYSTSSGAIAVFAKNLDSTEAGAASVRNTGHGLQKEARERMILQHEAAHAFGLVNCGIPMVQPHERLADPCHSANHESILATHGPNPVDHPHSYARHTVDPYRRGLDRYDLEDLHAFKATEPATMWPAWR